MASVTFYIPDNKLDEFKAAFIRQFPVPIEDPPLTENEWIKKWGRIQYLRAYRNGKNLLAADAVNIDDEIIT